MPQDSSTLTEPTLEKNDDEMTAGDIQNLVGSPVDIEAPLLIDEGVFEQKQPSTPIYKNISLKTGLAAVASLFIILPLFALFASSLLKGEPEAQTEQGASTQTAVEETEEEKALRESEEQNAGLKRQLALQQQSFTAADVEGDPNAEGAASLTDARSPGTVSDPGDIQTSRPVTAAPPPPVAARSTPAPRSAAAPPPPRPQPSRAPIVARRTPVAASVSTAVSTAPRPAPISLAELSNKGSYGSLPQSTTQPFSETLGGSFENVSSIGGVGERKTGIAATSTIPIAINPARVVAAIPFEKEEEPRERTRPLPQAVQGSFFSNQALPTYQTLVSSSSDLPVVELAASYEAERALILGEEISPTAPTALPSTIPPGSLAAGQLSQPISWTPDMSSIKGAVTLTSPLMSAGYEVLPVGTEIMVEVVSYSESGAVELRPTAILLSQASALNLAIPLDAVQILAANGGYPIAQIENGSESALRKIDRQQAFLGALSGAGQFISRPESESSFVGAGGSSFNRDYGDSGSIVSAAGAILGGAADAVLSARSQRLADQAEVISDRPYIWTLPSDTGVQLFFSQEVTL